MGYIELAKDVLKLASHNLRELGKLSLHDLQSVKDIGEAIATLIAAALEIEDGGRSAYLWVRCM